jgi:ribosomal-protein-alanine N-acetyltransferase
MTPQDLASTHAAAFRTSRPWTAQEFAALLENPHTQIFGDTQCFALIRLVADEAELLTIATHPDRQRRGLARSCMAAWHQATRQQGATRCFLEVAADNHPAIALYTSCGYFRCGERKGYYTRNPGPNVDAIVMECRLDRP